MKQLEFERNGIAMHRNWKNGIDLPEFMKANQTQYEKLISFNWTLWWTFCCRQMIDTEFHLCCLRYTRVTRNVSKSYSRRFVIKSHHKINYTCFFSFNWLTLVPEKYKCTSLINLLTLFWWETRNHSLYPFMMYMFLCPGTTEKFTFNF